jgi:hypothetical protein
LSGVIFPGYGWVISLSVYFLAIVIISHHGPDCQTSSEETRRNLLHQRTSFL